MREQDCVCNCMSKGRCCLWRGYSPGCRCGSSDGRSSPCSSWSYSELSPLGPILEHRQWCYHRLSLWLKWNIDSTWCGSHRASWTCFSTVGAEACSVKIGEGSCLWVHMSERDSINFCWQLKQNIENWDEDEMSPSIHLPSKVHQLDGCWPNRLLTNPWLGQFLWPSIPVLCSSDYEKVSPHTR